jgi:hypothetical protein
MRALLPLALVALAACDGGSGTMRPGQDCLSCHKPGGEKTWTLAGTVFPTATSAANQGLSDATIHITDATSATMTLTSISVGNFYTSNALTFPVAVAITHAGNTVNMNAAPSGACNSCHTEPPLNGAPGRINVP